jgi:hypothetical protein
VAVISGNSVCPFNVSSMSPSMFVPPRFASPADQVRQKQTQRKHAVAEMYIELKGIPTRPDEKWWGQFESVVIDKN